MPVGTAVHDRTLALCESLNYREWSGYFAVSAYESHHEHEYNAIRNAAALIDVSPLFKYLIPGRDAARLVDRLITRDVSKMAVGQVFYTPWCDEHGLRHRRWDRVAARGTALQMDGRRSQPAVVPAERRRASRQLSRTSRRRSRRWRCRGRLQLVCCERRRAWTSTA